MYALSLVLLFLNAILFVYNTLIIFTGGFMLLANKLDKRHVAMDFTYNVILAALGFAGMIVLIVHTCH